MLSNMSSVQIQALLRGPSVVESEKQTLDFLNSHFTSLQDLEGQSNLSEMVEEAKMRTDSLKAEVRRKTLLQASSLLLARLSSALASSQRCRCADSQDALLC